MELAKRTFGASGPEISRVGFGAWAIGGGGWVFSWGPQDDDESLRTMRHAIDCGINWIDTAAVYGLGHSEELVARLLRQLPSDERPYVFTKCGVVWDARIPMQPTKRSLHPTVIRQQCEDSLRRLDVERIDLLQFHWPDEVSGAPVEDSWGEMVRLAEEGKVRWLGVCNFGVSLLERCEAVRHVDSLQPPFSLIKRSVAAAEIPWCAANGTGVIGYSPMQSGLLTERWTEDRVRQLADDDWRRRGAEFRSPNLERNLALRDALVPIAEEHATSVASVAVAWVLAWSGVTGAIVGARSPEQVDGWLDAATLELTDDDFDVIGFAVSESGAGSGPADPRQA